MGLSKRRKIIDEKVDAMKAYSLDDAIEILRNLPKLKFSETVDISINLGIDITNLIKVFVVLQLYHMA